MIEDFLTICVLIGAWTIGHWVTRVVLLMFFDRTGNSGRIPESHWRTNPRIKGRDDHG